MFPNVLTSTAAFSFPVVVDIGTLYQILPDKTESTLRFGTSGNAPAPTSLVVQYSVGGGGPWTTIYTATYPLNGSPIADDPTPLPGPYYSNNYFRYRWENLSLGYVGPWVQFAGPTTKNRWDVSTTPIAPTLIVSAVPFDLGFGLPNGVDVTVKHSLVESANYSYTGIYVEATALMSNGFYQTQGGYFVGWGASVGADQVYRIVFGSGSVVPVSCSAARAAYYVLGNPPPGILGSFVNL